MIALITILALVAAWLGYILFRLGVHQRLPLVVGPISLERIPDRASRLHGDRPLFTCDRPAEWCVPALADRYADPLAWSARRIATTTGYVAAVVRQAHVGHGDRVAIFKRNHLDVHLLTAAVVRAGGIACPMSARFEADDVQPYLDHIGARVLVTDVPTLQRVMRQGAGFGGVSTIIVAARRNPADAEHRAVRQLLLEARPDIDVIWLEDALERVADELPAVARTAGETLYLVHSSGTTGFPKAVILNNGAQSHAVRGWLSYVHLSRTHDRGLLAVPNNHQAVILSFNSALLLGLRIHWMSACAREDLDAEVIATELARGGYTGFFAFPLAYTLLKEVDWARHDVTRMRFWASTADAAHEAIIRHFTDRGSVFRSLGLPLRGSIYLDAQGSSEVGTPSVLRYITAYTRNIGRRIGRPGSTPFGPHVRIVTASGDRVPPGEPGRLEVRGRTLFGGYWNDRERTDAAMHDGWFFTGDVVREADDENLVQLDREVDVIHTSFGPVYSLPIEECLHHHPAVFDVCVYGARQPDGTQAPAAAVALRTGMHVETDALWRELNARLGRREQLVGVHVLPWSEFPIGITGKTLKRVFRERTERRSMPAVTEDLRHRPPSLGRMLRGTGTLCAWLFLSVGAFPFVMQAQDVRDASKWHVTPGLHAGTPSLVSVVVGVGRSFDQRPDGWRDVFVVVEPGVSAGRISAGYGRFKGNLASGYTVRTTFLRRWKTSSNYMGMEGSLQAMMLGPRVGVFVPLATEHGERVRFSVDFGVGY